MNNTKVRVPDGDAVVIDLDVARAQQPVDVTNDPQFLGEAPAFRNGACTKCGRSKHFLDGVLMTARGFHRFDLSPSGGYYSDELEANQR